MIHALSAMARQLVWIFPVRVLEWAHLTNPAFLALVDTVLAKDATGYGAVQNVRQLISGNHLRANTFGLQAVPWSTGWR